MNPSFQNLMNEAARLTRSGNLQGATQAIQAALGGSAASSAASAPAQWPVIDVPARELPPQAPGTADATGSAQFVAGAHANASGRREYKLYVPPSAGAAALPLVVMLHGCTQTPDDFAAGTAMNDAALAHGFYVLYPAQSRKANPQGCWNWFKHSHQERGRGEAGLLAGMTREVMAQHSVDPQRVYVAGLSAGGAMAAILGAAYPDLYAAVGVHSGLAAGAASDLPSALAAMKSGSPPARGHGAALPPTIIFHGDADSTVHPANAGHVAQAVAGTASIVETQQVQRANVRASTRRIHSDPGSGQVLAEHWVVHGAPHAWSGGSSRGSYTDARGPDASAEMVRFFLEHPRQPLQ